MCKLVQTLRMILWDKISSLRLFRLKMKKISSFSRYEKSYNDSSGSLISEIRITCFSIQEPQGQYMKLTFQIWTLFKLKRESCHNYTKNRDKEKIGNVNRGTSRGRMAPLLVKDLAQKTKRISGEG